MAGTMAFYNGMAPGITKMVESIAGNEASRRGYRDAAASEHNIASARKANVESDIKSREYQDAEAGSLNFVLGQHGLEAKRFNEFVAQANGRAPAGGFSPEETTKYNAALRDYGALRRGGEQQLGSYVGNMAKAPGEQAESNIKGRMATAFETGQGFGPHKSAMEVMGAGNAALGRGNADTLPGDVKTWQWLQTQPPEVRAAYDKREMAIRASGASPGATVMTPVPMLGPDGKTTVYGYPSKQGGDIKPTSAVVPTPPSQSGPQSSVGKLMNDVKKGYVGGGGGQAPAQGIPAGAKQVGTAGGKPVYEVNGKRYVSE